MEHINEKSSPDPRDQRLHSRVDYSDPVRLFVARSMQPLDCPSVNISRGGLSVSTRRPLIIGRELSLEVETGEGPVRVESAEVVWARPLDGGTHAWEMGLQFVCLSQKNRERMESLVDRLTGVRRGEERVAEPLRGGPRCGPTFDREEILEPAPEPAPVREQVDVVIRPDRRRELRGRVLGLAAVVLAIAALLSFLVIGLTAPSERASRRQIEQLATRLKDAERQVIALRAKIDGVMLASKKCKTEPPAALSAAVNPGKPVTVVR